MGKGGNTKKKVIEWSRKIIFGLNVTYLILGIVIVSFSARFRDEGNTAVSTEIIARALVIQNISDLMLFAGIVTIVVSLAGMVGTLLQLRKALIFYMITLLVNSFLLMAVGSDLISKDATTMEPEWQAASSSAAARREQLMSVFQCCGFYRNTDSYKFQACMYDLNERPNTKPCAVATNQFLAESIYPVASGAIWIGVIELLSTLFTCGLVFASKENRNAFYDNPFRDG